LNNSKKAITEAVELFTKFFGINKFNVEVSFCSSEDIQKINYKFRKINKPTNVLSFPYENLERIDKNCEGEILICNDLLLEESCTQNKNHIDHFLHLLIHSFLHLKGYGHDNENDAILMEQKEIEFLSQIGISNPYK
jgi:probable rRNA maturation factor